eukprot:TRINITY_DN1067_c0_g2_i5.p1 TRINITY_DN1067_c0_g2~~TRINITY_DN1067_c0_g2_i5.p1  ORF type:complete len:175 (+),score=22.89 TRINITY_DN1067_c0_g2_i5:222-746(+)
MSFGCIRLLSAHVTTHCLSGAYPYLRLAAASTAVSPEAVAIAHSALRLLEVFPGRTVCDLLNVGWPTAPGMSTTSRGVASPHLLIGRSAPLSPSKSQSHFPLLRSGLSVPYDRMIFFDDCTWDDHCADVMRTCPGVVAVATPDGLSPETFTECLRRFASQHGRRPAMLTQPVWR